MVHDDGTCQNGYENMPLDGKGTCVVCGIHPDTQSTAILFLCPVHRVNLRFGHCPQCLITYDVSL